MHIKVFNLQWQYDTSTLASWMHLKYVVKIEITELKRNKWVPNFDRKFRKFWVTSLFASAGPPSLLRENKNFDTLKVDLCSYIITRIPKRNTKRLTLSFIYFHNNFKRTSNEIDQTPFFRVCKLFAYYKSNLCKNLSVSGFTNISNF